MKTLLLSLVMLTFAPASHAQRDELPSATNGMPNGRLWASLSGPAKLTYLLGLRDGALAMAGELSSKTQVPTFVALIDSVHDSFNSKANYDEIEKQLNSFYQDSANARIPIIKAYQYCLKRIKGAPATELDGFLNGIRRAVN
jgi:hypothetical protein